MSPQAGTIELERRIRARPEVVFAFFTDPEKYRLWQGVAASLEPVPGGRYHVDFTPRGGARGHYLVVEPPRRLAFTWGWAFSGDPERGRVLPLGIEEVLPDSTTVEITLVPDGEGTILQFLATPGSRPTRPRRYTARTGRYTSTGSRPPRRVAMPGRIPSTRWSKWQQ
jgi:uncharacterized protein YndB with AHSA1/START domain